MSKRTDSHTISHAESIYSGDAYQAGAEGNGRGIPRASLVQVSLGAPIVADPNGFVTGEDSGAAPTGGFPFALTFDGALWSTPDSNIVLDVPRGVQVVSASGACSAVFVFYGTDKYGVPMQESVTANAQTVVFGKKAFKTITSITVSKDTETAVLVGSSDILGLPFRLENVADVVVIDENDSNVYQIPTKTASDPAAITGLVPEAQLSSALTIGMADTTPPTNYDAVSTTNPVTNTEGDAISAALSLLEDETTLIELETSKTKIDLDATKVVVDRLVTESTDYKDTLDKIIADVLAIRDEVVKLVADAVAVDVGTLVKADATATATATTGDVRGTYNPTAVLDGTKIFKLTFKPKGRNTRGAYGSVQYRA